MKFETICQHLAEDYSFSAAVVPPLFQSSLFVYADFEDFANREELKKQYIYTRVGNPTTDIAEKKLAAMEQTERCRLFGSGMGAISAAVMSCTRSGGHVVCTSAAYGPTKALIRDYLPKFGVESTFVDGKDLNAVEAAIRPTTTAIYMESPGTFLFDLQDIEAISSLAKSRNISSIIDNSYASPYYQQPAKFGADLIVHSATKYIGGHSDVVAGAVCGSEERLAKLVWEEGLIMGSVIDPFASWLLIRSLRTLPVRMERHRESASRIAAYLNAHDKCERVYYPGLPGHAGQDLFKKQMSGASGLLSFKPSFQNREQVKRFSEKLQFFQMGVSWGGHESLLAPINQPETNNEWVIRFSIGLENADDLLEDIESAFGPV